MCGVGAREEGGGVGLEWETGGSEEGVRSECRLRWSQTGMGGSSADAADDGAVILSSRCPLESLFGATLHAQQKVDQSAAALTKAEEEGGSSEVLAGAREALRAAEAECAAAIAKYDEARREAGETHMDRVEV